MVDKQPDRSQRLFEIFIWCLVAVSLSIVVTSLILSAFIRYQGLASLDDVAHVGEFWGGHLNSLALVALALGLLLQKKQLDSYQHELAKTEESLTKQLAAIEHDTAQQSVHFFLSQLQERSQSIEGTVTFYAPDGQQERRSTFKGVRYLADHLLMRRDTPDLIVVTVRLKTLKDYIAIADAIQHELGRMSAGSRDVVKVICNLLCPEIVRDHCEEVTNERTLVINKWNENPHLLDETKSTLGHLAERDYKIEIINIGGKYNAVAFNEMEQIRHTSGDAAWVTPEDALKAMCDRIR